MLSGNIAKYSQSNFKSTLGAHFFLKTGNVIKDRAGNNDVTDPVCGDSQVVKALGNGT